MDFDENFSKKIYHAIGVTLIKDPYPIFLVIQNILNQRKNPDIFVKIEEITIKIITVNVFLKNSQGDETKIGQFMEKYLYTLID